MNAIPQGYWQDSQGRLVPEANIRPIDLQRDTLVRDLVARVDRASTELSRLKRSLLDDISAHVALAAERYDVTISGAAGDMVLQSYDGLLKIERSVADRLVIGEEIRAAETLILEILDEIKDPTARAIVDRAFRRHRKTGELSVARLVDLAAVEIDDERWRIAVQAIREAIRATGTVVYFRAYRRANPTDRWIQIPLDFSSIAPACAAFAGPSCAQDGEHRGGCHA